MINVNINKDWIPFIVIAALAFVLLGQCSSNSALREDKKELTEQIINAKSNLQASQDSVEIYKTENGYLEAEIKIYVASGKELTEDYSDMIKRYQRVLRLNKNLEGVNALLSNTDASANVAIGYQSLQSNTTGGSNTAVAGEGYFIDTTSAAHTVTLPASPTLGDEISIIDYAGTFDTNNLTVGRNGNPIQGSAADLTVSVERAGFTLVYVDGTQGWLLKDK